MSVSSYGISTAPPGRLSLWGTEAIVGRASTVNPGALDQYPLGTLWTNTTTGNVYVQTASGVWTQVVTGALPTYTPTTSQAFNPAAALTCLGVKNFTLSSTAATYVTYYTYTGSGVLSRLWMAIGGSGPSPDAIGIQVVVDGTVCWGNTSTNYVNYGGSPSGSNDGVNNYALTLDRLFGASSMNTNPTGGGVMQPVFSNDVAGLNSCSNTGMGGYISLDTPFSSSVVIKLCNILGYSCGTVYLQPLSPLLPFRFLSTLTATCGCSRACSHLRPLRMVLFIR